MPWCETCSRFWNPNSVPPEGRCPSCGATLEVPPQAEPVEPVEPYRAPWHFKLMVVLAVVYLGWRLVQLVQVMVT
jgi:hypothetical protein